MTTVALERRLAFDVRALIEGATAVAVPAEGAHSLGLAGWLGVLAAHTVEVPSATIRGWAKLAWHIDVSGGALTKRFATAGLRPPKDYVMVYRAAALGALRAYGADVSTCTAILQMSAASNVYAFLRRLEDAKEAYGVGTLTATDVLHLMAESSPLWAFGRYVRPLLPHRSDLRWRKPVGYVTPLHKRG